MADGKLHEVELDAIRINEKRFRDQEEERQYKVAKAEAEAPKRPEVVEVKKKGDK